ncbi:uncharacterized protein V1510DRAFT_420234 [Dipodascopsis tothii]|uniref:uncharacterized protein n=1 Tax=Dipodascopsis tothii TaxID=44089 RepID=UPI0034CD763B
MHLTCMLDQANNLILWDLYFVGPMKFTVVLAISLITSSHTLRTKSFSIWRSFLAACSYSCCLAWCNLGSKPNCLMAYTCSQLDDSLNLRPNLKEIAASIVRGCCVRNFSIITIRLNRIMLPCSCDYTVFDQRNPYFLIFWISFQQRVLSYRVP